MRVGLRSLLQRTHNAKFAVLKPLTEAHTSPKVSAQTLSTGVYSPHSYTMYGA